MELVVVNSQEIEALASAIQDLVEMALVNIPVLLVGALTFIIVLMTFFAQLSRRTKADTRAFE
jgi:hypothetical protein